MWKFFQWIVNLFKKGAGAFLTLIKEAFPLVKQVLLSQLSSFGLQVIQELAAGNLSGPDKQKEAFNRIKAKAGEIQIIITDSLINSLIEILVQKYKTNHGE